MQAAMAMLIRTTGMVWYDVGTNALNLKEKRKGTSLGGLWLIRAGCCSSSFFVSFSFAFVRSGKVVSDAK